MASAFCPHGWPWFSECPSCATPSPDVARLLRRFEETATDDTLFWVDGERGWWSDPSVEEFSRPLGLQWDAVGRKE